MIVVLQKDVLSHMLEGKQKKKQTNKIKSNHTKFLPFLIPPQSIEKVCTGGN